MLDTEADHLPSRSVEAGRLISQGKLVATLAFCIIVLTVMTLGYYVVYPYLKTQLATSSPAVGTPSLMGEIPTCFKANSRDWRFGPSSRTELLELYFFSKKCHQEDFKAGQLIVVALPEGAGEIDIWAKRGRFELTPYGVDQSTATIANIPGVESYARMRLTICGAVVIKATEYKLPLGPLERQREGKREVEQATQTDSTLVVSAPGVEFASANLVKQRYGCSSVTQKYT